MNPLEEIERWQSIYDWLRRSEGFDEEAKKVEDLIKRILAGIQLQPRPSTPGVTQ